LLSSPDIHLAVHGGRSDGLVSVAALAAPFLFRKQGRHTPRRLELRRQLAARMRRRASAGGVPRPVGNLPSGRDRAQFLSRTAAMSNARAAVRLFVSGHLPASPGAATAIEDALTGTLLPPTSAAERAVCSPIASAFVETRVVARYQYRVLRRATGIGYREVQSVV